MDKSTHIQFFKILGLPFPLKTLPPKNRLKVVSLFLISGLFFGLLIPVGLWALLFAPMQSIVYWVIKISDFGGGIHLDFGLMKYAFIIAPMLTISILFLALFFRRTARNTTIQSFKQQHQNDRRLPILFLRSFKDDQILLKSPKLSILGRIVNGFQSRGNFDRVLFEEGTSYGQVVAIGNPDDSIPPYGASRQYFADTHWQVAMRKISHESKYIVICLDTTEGVLWELAELIKQGHFTKTLFLLPPHTSNSTQLQNLAEEIIVSLTSQEKASFCNTYRPLSFDSLIGFFIDHKKTLQMAYSKQASEISYLLLLRWFFRTLESV